MNFFKRLFRKKERELEQFSKIVNSYEEILHKIHVEMDKLYAQPIIKHRETMTVKEVLETEGQVMQPKDKTKLIKSLNNFAHLFDTKLKKEIEKLTRVLTQKTNTMSAYNTALFYYQKNIHKKPNTQNINKHVNLLKKLKQQIYIVSIRIDLTILELKDETEILQEISTKAEFNKEIIKHIDNHLDKLDENTVKITELIDKLMQELNLLKSS